MTILQSLQGPAKQNCKKALTESDALHICPFTDAALPVSPALFVSVANTEWITGPPV